MDKIDKSLAKLGEKEKGWVRQIIKQLLLRDFQGLDMNVLSIARRSEKTYK